MFAIDAAKRRIAAATSTAVQTLRSKRVVSARFFVSLLAGAGFTAVGLHQVNRTQPDLVLAITLYPVTTPAGQLAVLTVAVAVLIGFLLWSKRATSASFFRGVLAGNGFILSFDIVWVHWIFGLHHLTNTEMDLFLEPPLVLLGLVFLWFAITRERRQASKVELRSKGAGDLVGLPCHRISAWPSATLVYEPHWLETRHVAGIKALNPKPAVLDQIGDPTVEMTAA